MNSILLLAVWAIAILVTAWLGTTGRRDPYWHVIEVRDDWADLAEAVGVLAEPDWRQWETEIREMTE